MKEEFTEKLRLNKKNQEQLEVINSIIEEYARDGYTLTLRQLYYQLVSRDIIPNQQKEYAKLSTLLVKGRMAGFVDWDAIEDRIRVPNIPYSVDDIEDAIQDTINQYRLNRQDGQEVYIELWVEKDALSGVLKRITHHYHINLMVNRGYSSCTAMHDAYERFVEKVAEGKKVVILYLGDHDPSGLDMIRDITDRTKEFLINSKTLQGKYNYDIDDEEIPRLAEKLRDEYGDEEEFYTEFDGETMFDCAKAFAYKLFDEQVEVRQIGLTTEQVKLYAPPPNPAKITDPRAKNYIAQFGRTSWEVDALKPEILHSLVREGVEGLIDMKLFKDQIKKEESDKKKLEKFVKEKKK